MNEDIKRKAIGKGIAKQMTKAYEAKKLLVNTQNNSDTKGDTLSIWISRKNYNLFFTDENLGANGVRIYLGVTGTYTDGNEKFECKPGCHNQTNLIFVPTINDGPDEPTMENSINYIEKNTNASNLVFGGGRIEDDNDMCPPPPSGTSCVEIQ